MKTLIITLVSALFLTTLNVKSSPTDIAQCKKDARNQIVNILAASDIEESGNVTVYFYIYNNSVKVKKVLGTNPVLNNKVKELLESTSFRKNVLNGYYTIDINMNGGSNKPVSLETKKIFKELYAEFINELKNKPFQD